MEQAERTTIWLRKGERIDSLRIRHDGKMKFYAFTYRVLDRGKWRPVVRWDNFDSLPHVDKYDENGGLIEQKPCQAKTLRDVVTVVSIWHRNLMAMNLEEL